MSATDAELPRPARPHFTRIRLLRLVLPVFAAALTLLVIGWAVVGAIRGSSREAAAPPLELTSPRMIGQDNKRRPFVVTAQRAVREPGATQRIRLEHPELVRQQGGPDALHVVAGH